MTRSEMVEHWLQYAAQHTTREDIFLAGIGIVIAGNNAEYYAQEGLDKLLQAALNEVDGTPSHPAWPCGVKPTKF